MLGPLLRRYPFLDPNADPVPLGNRGGFSGARLWKLDGPLGSFCLRRWPAETTSVPRLTFIHRLVRQARDAGLTFVPVQVPAADGTTFVCWQGHLWEIN